MKFVELFVCEGRWSRAGDPLSADASNGGFNGVGLGVLDGTDAKLKRCSVHIVGGYRSLDGVWVEGDA